MYSPSRVSANQVSSSSSVCVDILLVFTRGSGQNLNRQFLEDPTGQDFQRVEPESYSFFNWHREHLENEYPNVTYKAVSIHDFPGEYSDVGYRAVGVGLQRPANSANAEVSWIPGEYQQSVSEGIKETVGYLKDQISACPDQGIIVGGYSQGAQVMGEALFQLSESERAKILGVGMFGDPKFIASTGGSLLNFLDEYSSYPWRRGTATNNDRGMLEPRIPYLPADMEKRAVSYCFKEDLICAGWSGLTRYLAEPHGGYSTEPMRNTVNELMHWAAPHLLERERVKGGLSSDPRYANQNASTFSKSRDVLLLFNDESNETVLQTLRYQLDGVVHPFLRHYSDTKIGAKAFGEGETGGQNLPRVNNIQALLPYVGYDPARPMFTASNLSRAINSRYPFAQPHMGGGDFPDPHGLAIEKSLFSGGWRSEAEKHIILITDRAPKESYSYNICHGTVRSWLQIPVTSGYDACFAKFGTDSWPKVLHPEVCETIHQVLIQETCHNPIPARGYTHFIHRNLEDQLKAAQAMGVAVSVVVPHKITSIYGYPGPDKMIQELKKIAQTTGGRFIYYDQRSKYEGVLLADTLQQVFSHTPHSLVLDPDQLGSELPEQKGTLPVRLNEPVILDVSQSNYHYDSYKWDFNNDGAWDQTTTGPVAEYTYSSIDHKFTRVLGVNSAGEEQAALSIPLLQDDADGIESLHEPPQIPEVVAHEQSDGSIHLAWQSDEPGDLLVIDPESNLPIATVSLSSEALTLRSSHNLRQLKIATYNNLSSSTPVIISVTQYVPPVVISIEPPPDEDSIDIPSPPDDLENPSTPTTQADPTICYKLQTCPREAGHWSQKEIGSQPVTSVTASFANSEISISKPRNVSALTSRDANNPIQQVAAAVSSRANIQHTPATALVSTSEHPPTHPAKGDSKLIWIAGLVIITTLYLMLKRSINKVHREV